MRKMLFILLLGIFAFVTVIAQKIDRKIIYFDFGKYELRPESIQILDSIYYRMTASATDTLYLIGHTDSIGSDRYNEKLSSRRVNAVQEYLMNRGISQDRIKTKIYGETKPIAFNDSDEGRQLNRRVDILIKSGKKEFVCKYQLTSMMGK